MAKGNGYWLWPAHMKSINLKSLAKRGTKHIFLHSYAISVHGKSSVISFIKKAHRHKMKVHLWMQVAYDGKTWVEHVTVYDDFFKNHPEFSGLIKNRKAYEKWRLEEVPY